MAATDQNYRSLKTLDILFALACLLMLLSILAMFAQDFLKPYKAEQYEFRQVERAMVERDLVREMPLNLLGALREAEAAVPKEEQAEWKKQQKAYHDARKNLQKAREEARKAKASGAGEAGTPGDDKVAAAQAAIEKVLEEGSDAVKAALAAENALMVFFDKYEATADAVKAAKADVEKVRDEQAGKIAEAQYAFSVADANYRSKKADYDSKESLYYIAVDRGEPKETLATLARELKRLRDERDDLKALVDKRTRELRDAEKPLAAVESELAAAEKADKEKRAKFERFQKLAEQKKWTLADTILSSPVMDMFNSPYKIQQYTLDQYPIDYSFKHVTRYDRCTTCHQGMEKGDYDAEALIGLTRENKNLEGDLKRFLAALKQRQENGEGTAGFNIDDIPEELTRLPASRLTEARVKEFAAHPRLDLFVGPDSPHPVERFGCTSCHSGQGSATDFQNASHTPNTPEEKHLWESHHGWSHSHYWDYPMLAQRFTESSCLKCHHQVTDLVRYGSKEEAPKLLKGYNLVRENGCFGCHEIAGLNKGRAVGPDMRLEPGVPLEFLSPTKRAEVLADTANPPGTMRKVGPSLYRLNEKTHSTWVAQWIHSPRGFRPDTRMPHFYHIATVTKEELAKTGSGQEEFPDAEIQAITTYLAFESQKYLDGKDGDAFRRNILARQEQLKVRGTALSDSEKKELDDLARKLLPDSLPTLELRDPFKPLKDQILDHDGHQVTLPDMPKDAAATADRVKNGARLFMERGCLACHQHSGPTPDDNGDRRDGLGLKNPVTSEAHFGPNLSRMASKLGQKEGDKESARRWLVQWLLNPNIHFPRTRMPVTFLSPADANDVALWLLEKSEEWKEEDRPVVPQPSSGTLARLTAVYLQRVRPMKDVNDLLSIDGPGDSQAALRWLRNLRADSDEAILAGTDNPEMQRLLADPARSSEMDQVILANAVNPENQKRYIGRKAIVRQGCFACHNIPGFETAKPIGTPLNDWGKKDAERLAFEDGAAFVKDRYHILENVNTYQEMEEKLRKLLYAPEVPEAVRGEVDKAFEEDPNILTRVKTLLTLATGAIGNSKEAAEEAKKEVKELEQQSKHMWEDEKGKPPFEEFYYEALEHHFREGFLQLKLKEPRSYDYKRQRVWDDRLRMPQFRFAHPIRQAGETDEAFRARQYAEEAEAREAVMTFILGLVAEPVPAKYLNTPKPDRQAEVRGLQVLEKFNCAGCHQTRAGVIELRPNADTIKALEAAYAGMVASPGYQDDFVNEPFLRMHNAWKALPQPLSDRMMIFGNARPSENEEGLEVFLSQALQFTTVLDGKKETRDILAASSPPLLIPSTQPLLSNSPMFGGAFPNLIADYIAAEYKGVVQNAQDARSKLPPSLLHEGERVQTDWLFQFLRDPQPVRPVSWMALRMPKFNMSEEEARALVDYFAAVDRMNNPGVGLVYPYQAIPQREDKFWRERTQEYRSRLKPEQIEARVKDLRTTWKLYAEDQQANLKLKTVATEAAIKAAEEAVKAASDVTKKAASQTALDNAKRDLDDLKRQETYWKTELEKNFPDLEKEWRETGMYATDAFRVLTKTNFCSQCHDIGQIRIQGPKGPPLDQAHQRLRPDWMARWIAHPQRMLPYTSPMPQNFLRTKENDPAQRALFDGGAFEQVKAVRDVIMNFPKVAEMPANRFHRPTEGGK